MRRKRWRGCAAGQRGINILSCSVKHEASQARDALYERCFGSGDAGLGRGSACLLALHVEIN